MADREELVLGLDLGTTNFKAGLYTRNGTNVGIGRAEVLLDSADGIESVLPVSRFTAMLGECINLALQDAGAAVCDIKAVSYSSQTNSFLLLDEDYNPLTPLVIWNDRRAESPDSEFRAFAGHPEFLEHTGVGLFGPLSATAKLLWFRKNRPDLWGKTAGFMSISDYLCFLLTGQNVGDISTASMLGLWSVKQECWWNTAFELLGLDPKLFPECVAPGCHAGVISEQAAAILPLPGGIPLAAGGQDHYIAALGAGIGRLADYSESTGTVLGLISLMKDFLPAENSVLGPGVSAYMPYYRMSFQDEGSVILNKFRNKYASGLSFDELGRLAGAVPPGSGGVFAVLKSESFSKENNFSGQSSETTAGQYVRAVMEAIAASLKRMFDDAGVVPSRILATGGGAQSDLWLQIKADMLNAEIIAVNNQEPACGGAAMLAAKAAGWCCSLKELPDGWVKKRREFRPEEENRNYYHDWYQRYGK